MFDRNGDYNAAKMHFPCGRPTVIALLFLAVISSSAQTPSGSPIDERIRQADALQEKGALAEARKVYESVLASLRTTAPSPQLGYVLNALSQVASAEGNYDEAISSAQQAAEVYNKLGDKKKEAYALNYRGIAEVQRGFYPPAQATLAQALALSKGDLESEVSILNNLGTADYYPGKYLESLRDYESALAIVNQNAGQPWSNYWRQITEINEATVYQRLGRYQRALEIYQRVEQSSKALTVGDRGHLLTNLGALYRRLGDPWKALDSYRAALGLFAKQHDADGEISVLKNIGIVYALDQGDLTLAQQFFQRALTRAVETRNQREEMQGHLYLGETLLRKAAINAGHEQFQLALMQARHLGTKEEQWKALYGAARSEELSNEPAKAEVDYREAIAIIEASRSQLQLSTLRTEFLADKRDVYDALIALLLKKNDAAEAFLFLERSRARTFQDRLASSAQGQAERPALSLAEVRSYLDGATILLEFWTSGDRLALIWCMRESYGVVQNQLSADDKQRILASLKALPDNLRGDWRQEVAILGRLIPGGVPRAANLRRALIVPDGWLSSLPFDLLPDGEKQNALLIERLDISYLPTAALLRRVNPRDRNPHFPWMRQLVAFGDPAMPRNQHPADDLERGPSPQPLPFSAKEIQEIAAMSAGRSELFLGPADLKRAFLAGQANSAMLLHVSSHAFTDADNPENSRILFSPEDPDGTADYVFLRELYDLDLSGVNLATISACNTERGKMIRGEGVQAFGRALLFAGSRSALTTLWRVDDQPTAEFMKQFYYFALQRGESKAEALRSAKIKFLRSGTPLANPAHWAAFVLNGDGFSPLPIFVSWPTIVVTTLVLTIVGIGVALLIRLWHQRRILRIDGA
jgi:CHAT domain-containing protein/tetratricopeptide (TPR) repeat protein